MRPNLFAAVAGTLAVVALLLLFGGRPEPEPDYVTAESPRFVTMVGEGEVRAKPDQVLVTLGVWSYGASAAEAEALALASVGRIGSAVTTAGAEDQSLERTEIAISPVTNRDYRGVPQLTGFEATASIQAVVANPTRLQAVVDAGLAAGATSVGQFQYVLADTDAAFQAATRQALENARQRATALLRAEGHRLGNLHSMEVLPEEIPPAIAETSGALLYRVRVKATFHY